MLTDYTGHIAALLTSLAWTSTSVFFTIGGRRVGSPIVNRTRLLLAVIFVLITHTLTLGSPLPDAEPFRWGWLSLSGLLGFIVGDACLFQAFVMIGPRLAMLLMALAPVINTAMGWLLLGETLAPLELLGIALAVGGVMVVVSDRRNGAQQPGGMARQVDDPARDTRAARRTYLIGVLFGLGGAFGQATGLFASERGLVGDFPALSGNLIRLLTAATIIWVFTLARGQAVAGFRKLREHPRALYAVIGGAVMGPFIGVWFSLIAVQRAPLGIASTLMSLAPIFLIPVARVVFKERVTARAVSGTILTVSGVALLFLAPLLMTG
ncbi:MAG: DMT family transporter [Anaerolineae bacterium]|nr:DMT family transporter [Anaerolineae bacterium]